MTALEQAREALALLTGAPKSDAQILAALILDEREACAKAICVGCDCSWPLSSIAVHEVPISDGSKGYMLCDAHAIRTRT